MQTKNITKTTPTLFKEKRQHSSETHQKMDEHAANLSTTNARTSAQLSPLICFNFTEAYFERVNNSSTPYVVTSVLNALLSVTAFWSNALILVAIWKAAALHWPSKLLIFNLALTDFVIGLVVQPLFAAFTAKRAQGFSDTSFCGVRLSFHLVSSCLSCVSFFSVAAISFDRYVALRYHFRYREFVNVKRVSALVLIIWLIGGLWSSTWILKNQLYYPLAIAILCIFLPVTTFVYIDIYRGLHRQQHRVRPELSDDMNNTLNVRRYRSSATGMLYIYCLMLLCYLPYLCTNMIIRFTSRTAYMQTVLDLASTIVFMNSSLNPIVYCWRLRTIRTAVLETLQGCSECTQR